MVATNWQVDDVASALLVADFGKRVAAAKGVVDYAQALHEARRAIRKKFEYRSPYYWGAFVLAGPPR